MRDIDFRNIAPRCGGKRQAFEELCCQLARRTLPTNTPYTRLRGDGGDGGVELLADPGRGQRHGWQAKYVFDINALLKQSNKSLETALNIHNNLTTYVLCFPFDLTGKTRRSGSSALEKIDAWRSVQEEKARNSGRALRIEIWPAFKLRDLILCYDGSGGIREFFFNQDVLDNQWFSSHIVDIEEAAGPRYTPDLNIETPMWHWFEAFGRTEAWSDALAVKLAACWKTCKDFEYVLERTPSDSSSPTWPDDVRESGQNVCDDMKRLRDLSGNVAEMTDVQVFVAAVDEIVDRLRSIELELAAKLDHTHGEGTSQSPGFRQYMAEYEARFPAANLDLVRDSLKSLSDLRDWLNSPSSSLAYQRSFVLSGAAGSGKTHGVCSVAKSRHERGLATCVVFGHQFGGEPDPWVRLLQTLNLPQTLGREGLLDMLEAVGEASGAPVILCIDAINDTRPLHYWRDRLPLLSLATSQRQHVRICATCRTPFVPVCLREDDVFLTIEHAGFVGMEHHACRAFFEYYDLDPPVFPILQPEFANPLYLRLVCETVRSRGLRSLPLGWQSFVPAVQAFLGEKERQFAAEHGTSSGRNFVGGCLMAIVRVSIESGRSGLAWSEAESVAENARPQARDLRVLEWLVRNDLLIEDAPEYSQSMDVESTIRLSFERLSDFLGAKELLARCRPDSLTSSDVQGTVLWFLVRNTEAVGEHIGILSALSILLPEEYPGHEITSLSCNDEVRQSLLAIVIDALPSREPSTVGSSVEKMIREALACSRLSQGAMESVVASCWRTSSVDGFWLDRLLKERRLAERDSYWCGYLYMSFDDQGAVYRLIEGAFELPLDRLDPEAAQRWATVLLWFTAAADRRVKDGATRAVTRILSAVPTAMCPVVMRMLDADDDEVRERALLSSYGALMASRSSEACDALVVSLTAALEEGTMSFQNALIRDDIKCIGELWGQLKQGERSGLAAIVRREQESDWPLDIPSEEVTKEWEKPLGFWADEFMSDFFKYSMGCLRVWEHTIAKPDMARWMIGRIARVFGYIGSGCRRYDEHILSSYGGGRSKPVWAERIGKKYQWIAMYQLASRLDDHVVRKEKWRASPRLPRPPLILLEERKLDPTLPRSTIDDDDPADSWWIPASADLDDDRRLSDKEWVASESGVPDLRNFLSGIERGDRIWMPLVAYPSWGRPKDDTVNSVYRNVWVHVFSYVVKPGELRQASEFLNKKNFFGRWMPEGASWLYGFAGEYPWGSAYSVDPEEEYARERESRVEGTSVKFEPCWNQLVVEWEYDATIEHNFDMNVPARFFFSKCNLWWDWNDGFCGARGRTTFRDPSVTEKGPSALMVDFEDLLSLLESLGLSIIWTLLGEKWILGGRLSGRPLPRRTFSQVAYLDSEGVVKFGEIAYFDDGDSD